MRRSRKRLNRLKLVDFGRKANKTAANSDEVNARESWGVQRLSLRHTPCGYQALASKGIAVFEAEFSQDFHHRAEAGDG